MATKEKNYKWFDEALFNQSKKAIETLVEIMQRNGGQWRKEWIDLIAGNRYNEIYNECFKDACVDLGFVETLRTDIVAPTPVYSISDDEGVFARVEVKKRLRGVKATFDEINNIPHSFPILGGWMLNNSAGIVSHFKNLIELSDEGFPSLAPDYETKLEALCTHEIPKRFRALADMLRDNEELCLSLIKECNRFNKFNPWETAFESGKFSMRDFAISFCRFN